MEDPSGGTGGTADSTAETVAVLTAESDPSAVDAVLEAVRGLDRPADAVLVDLEPSSGADGDPVAASSVGDRRQWEAIAGTVPTVAVPVGRAAVAPIAGFEPSVPVVPVSADPGSGSLPDSVPVDRLTAALEAVLGGETTERRRPAFSVTVGDEAVARAAVDVALVAAEPATISEFAVRDREELVDVVRADGVVAATPWGSGDYARAAGGVTLAPGVDALSVVPVAPFTTDRPRWVLPTDDVAITVERDEVGVRLQVDGRDRAGLDRGETITVARSGSIAVHSPVTARE